MARALGLREDGARPPRELLLTSLHAKCALLVLDNFEQVVNAAPLVAALVAAAPRLVVLVTSRIPLRIQAEQQFPVPPLVTPAPNKRNAASVMGHPAVQLFMARARAALSTFDPDAENIAAVAEICRPAGRFAAGDRVGGGARMALLPPVTLLALLGRRPGVLKAKARDLPERQQTLGATIDWSYALLPRRRSGRSFVVSVSSPVVAPGRGRSGGRSRRRPRDGDILDWRGDAGGSQPVAPRRAAGRRSPRFRMLETIREYARERLIAEGEERRGTARPRERITWHSRRRRGHAPLRGRPDAMARSGSIASTTTCVRRSRGPTGRNVTRSRGLRLAGALWRFWYIRCYLSEGRGWLQTCIALPAPPGAAGSTDRCPRRARRDRLRADRLRPRGNSGGGKRRPGAHAAMTGRTLRYRSISWAVWLVTGATSGWRRRWAKNAWP